LLKPGWAGELTCHATHTATPVWKWKQPTGTGTPAATRPHLLGTVSTQQSPVGTGRHQPRSEKLHPGFVPEMVGNFGLV